jgi:hypothetical protein
MRDQAKAIVLCLFLLTSALAMTGQANDDAAWKKEFERICAQTEIATSLTTDQLRQLISDSDELLAQLTGLDDPWAKIYIFRIKKCRGLFEYTLEWKEINSPENTS